ncbi:MAG: D-glycero-beta-D-manno-heptose 1-phosphate adenylyltransferase [Cyclobacteriaceae bacterium]
MKPLELIEKWKNEGHRIVFTNGCFDLLHPGHVVYLEQAKALGDKLIIGLNSDESVSRLKGENRPIIKLEHRQKMLESLRFVDLVIPFKEDTPITLIECINPHVLVKGGDYAISNIVGAKFVLDNGGIVKALTFVEGFSSSELIGQIKEL